MNRSRGTTIVQARSFVALMKTGPGNHEQRLQGDRDAEGRERIVRCSVDRRFELSVTCWNSDRGNGVDASCQQQGQFICGDDAEWGDGRGARNMANAVYVEYDLTARRVTIMSSIVGLPPVFVCTVPGMVIITSDIYQASRIPGVALHFDAQSVHDLCRVGHPIDHRTMFREVSMVPGGHRVTLSPSGTITMSRSWQLNNGTRLPDWSDYLALQGETFTIAMGDLDLTNSYLSLTAGLDTRSILAAMVRMNTQLPAYTMSGKTLSLDARTARALCRAYGLDHTVIVLGDEFTNELADCALEASRLSGGLVSLGQAHEVYFYKKIKRANAARLCGNLGNQVGRRGVEKVSLRNADPLLLSDEIIKHQRTASDAQWYAGAGLGDGGMDYRFLLEEEVPFSSVANYSLGSHFSRQQSPYANYRVIEAAQYRPEEDGDTSSSQVLRARLKDLHHRFFGESARRSFQVKYIKDTGGYVAACPINWGWRARGGVSAKGMLLGGCAFADALLSSRGNGSGLLSRGLKAVHIAGLHEYTPYRSWLLGLREFVFSTLLSRDVRQNGLFHEKRLAVMVEEHYSHKRSHHKELGVALDLALAQQAFRASIH